MVPRGEGRCPRAQAGQGSGHSHVHTRGAWSPAEPLEGGESGGGDPRHGWSWGGSLLRSLLAGSLPQVAPVMPLEGRSQWVSGSRPISFLVPGRQEVWGQPRRQRLGRGLWGQDPQGPCPGPLLTVRPALLNERAVRACVSRGSPGEQPREGVWGLQPCGLFLWVFLQPGAGRDSQVDGETEAHRCPAHQGQSGTRSRPPDPVAVCFPSLQMAQWRSPSPSPGEWRGPGSRGLMREDNWGRTAVHGGTASRDCHVWFTGCALHEGLRRLLPGCVGSGGAMGAEIHPHSITSSGPCPRQHCVHLEENDALAVALGGHLVRPYRSARTPSSVAEVGRGGGGKREENSGKPSSECASASAWGSERHQGPHGATCCHIRDTAWELWVPGGMGVSGTPRPPADGASAHAGISLRCLPARVDGLKLARPGSPALSPFPRCSERCSVSVQPHTDEVDGKPRPSARGLESHASVGGGGDQRGLLGSWGGPVGQPSCHLCSFSTSWLVVLSQALCLRVSASLSEMSGSCSVGKREGTCRRRGTLALSGLGAPVRTPCWCHCAGGCAAAAAFLQGGEDLARPSTAAPWSREGLVLTSPSAHQAVHAQPGATQDPRRRESGL